MKKTPAFRLISLGMMLTMLLIPLTSQARTSISPTPGNAGKSGPDSFEIGLQSRQFTPDPGMSPEVQERWKIKVGKHWRRG